MGCALWPLKHLQGEAGIWSRKNAGIKNPGNPGVSLEASSGFEPLYKLLQSCA